MSRKLRHNKFLLNKPRSKRNAEDVLTRIAEDEIDEVDFIMEDITDEIQDLQASIGNNSGKIPLPCSKVNFEINCNQSVYTDKNAWKNSR